jgi:hypothetical protein
MYVDCLDVPKTFVATSASSQTQLIGQVCTKSVCRLLLAVRYTDKRFDGNLIGSLAHGVGIKPRLHLQQRVHAHTKCFFNSERHFWRHTRFAVHKIG